MLGLDERGGMVGKKRKEMGFLLKCWVMRFEMSLCIEIVNISTNEIWSAVIGGSNNFFPACKKVAAAVRLSISIENIN